MKRPDIDVDLLMERAKDIGSDLGDKAEEVLDSARKLAKTASYRGKDWLDKPTTRNAFGRVGKSIVNFFEDCGEGIKNWLLSKYGNK